MNVQDQAVRKRALAPNQSFIVQAPAGSGKTELLTQRFLTLLLHVPQAPEEVLAITFTRKAASEMRQRIVESLERAATQPQPKGEPAATNWAIARAVLARDQQMSWQLTESPSRLRILTIDGFCHALVRQMPLLSELGVIPTVTEEARRLYQLAAEQTLAPIQRAQPQGGARTSLVNSLKTVLGHLDNQLDRLQSLIGSMLARRDQWLAHIVPYFGRGEQLRDHLQRALEVIVEQMLSAQLADIHALNSKGVIDIDLRSVEPLLHYAADQLRGSLSAEAFDQHPFSGAFHGEALEPLRFWQAMAHLLTTQSSGRIGWRKGRGVNKRLGFFPATALKNSEEAATAKERKAQLVLILDALNESADHPMVEAALQALGEIRLLPAEPYREQQWRVIEALITVLIHAVGELKLVFQQEGEVDFNEVSMAALRALGDDESPSDLALKLDYKIQHILIDEFQDTSISQFELLRGLTRGWSCDDGRTLFLVGDPMQSIYRFREADVSLFLKARNEGVGDVALEFLQLKTNFRSDPAVIQWVNHVFRQVLPEQDNLVTGAVAYSDSVAGKAANDAGDAGDVGVSVDVSATDEQQTDRLIEKITRYRSASPDASIAILIRARTHATDLIRALRRANMSYQAIEIDALAQKPLIIDLLSLTKAIYFLSDSVAWLSLLRAPWCGLSLHDLHHIVQSREAGQEPLVWECCLTVDASILSEEGAARLRHVRQVMVPLLKRRRRYPVRETVEAAWQALGGVYYTPAEDLDDAERFFQLLESIDQGWDIVDIEQLSLKVERLFAQPKVTDKNPIQIMTVHKSKGLEFDAVFIPHLEKSGRHDDAALLSWLRQEHPEGARDLLLFAPIKDSYGEGDLIYDFIRKLERQKGAHELGRLFYVAATRAKRTLYLSATVTADEEEAVDDEGGLTHASLKLKNIKRDSLFSMIVDRAIGRGDIEQQLTAEHASEEGDDERADEPQSDDVQNDDDQQANANIHRLPIEALNQIGAFYHQNSAHQKHKDLYKDIYKGFYIEVPDLPVGVSLDHSLESSSEPFCEEAVSGWQRRVGTVLHRLLEGLEEGFSVPDSVETRFWEALLLREGLPKHHVSEALGMLERALRTMAEDQRGQWILRSRACSHNEFPLSIAQSQEVQGRHQKRVHRYRVDRLFIEPQEAGEGEEQWGGKGEGEEKEKGTLWIIDYKLAQMKEGEEMSLFLKQQKARYEQQLDRYAEAASALFSCERVALGLYFPLIKGWVSWTYAFDGRVMVEC